MLENHKTKLVLFDLDGTLIDTAPDFLTSLNNVLNKYGKKNVTAQEIRNHISEGSSKLIKFTPLNPNDLLNVNHLLPPKSTWITPRI